MTKALKQAVAAVERLPEADQDLIGKQVLTHVDKLRTLRADIDAGVRSLDRAEGHELDIDDVIVAARKRHEEER